MRQAEAPFRPIRRLTAGRIVVWGLQ